MKNIVIGALAATTLVSLAGNALLYQRYSTNRPLVRVGSQVISKKDYQDAVDYQTQGAILKKMVFSDLIDQAAARAGVTPTGKDVDAQVAIIQRTKPSVLAEANQDPAKMTALRADIQTTMALDNLRSQGITASDAEVAGFYARNKQAFALPNQIQTTLVVAANSVDAATAADLLKQATPLDVIARQPRLHVAGLNGFQPNLQALPPAVSQGISRQVFGMTPGSVKTIPVGGQFLVIRANKNAGAGVPPLSQIRDQVTRLARLQKAPPAGQEIVKLYHDAGVKFEVDKYATYFSDVQNAPPSGPKVASAQ